MKNIPREDYYTYDGPSLGVFDAEHLRKSLLIADPVAGDSMIYLLNPLAVAEDGEWEAWRFAHWIPGVERFPSFELLMQDEHESFLTTRLGQLTTGACNGPFAGPCPDRPRHAATPIGCQRQKPRRPTIPELITELESPSRASAWLRRTNCFASWVGMSPMRTTPRSLSRFAEFSVQRPSWRCGRPRPPCSDVRRRQRHPAPDWRSGRCGTDGRRVNALRHLSVDLHGISDRGCDGAFAGTAE